MQKPIYFTLLSPLIAASVGGLAYYLLAIVATRRLRKQRILPDTTDFPYMSLLKPLRGADPQLEQHLEGFFVQDYPSYQIIFAVRHETDPAVAIVDQLRSRYPGVSTHLIFTGEPAYANAKVYSMKKMSEEADADILVITDSDTSVSPDYLKRLAAAFASPGVGAVTNLYRGVGGADLWSKLEAIGMSTEFMAGVVVANHLEGMKFMLGPSMAIRASCLQAIGGFESMADYLADDFVLGHWSAGAGYRVLLSTDVINHHATASGFINSFKHRLRWNRSSRFSRPSGYYGQGFTYGLPWALILLLIAPFWWSATVTLAVIAARIWLAYELATRLLRDHSALRRFWMIPMQDMISFAAWIGGFLGREIIWRNERYRLLEGGRFAPVIPREDAGG